MREARPAGPVFHPITARGDLAGVCLGCGEVFIVDAGEVAWFTARDLALPRRCPECRAARQQARQSAQDGAGRDRGRRR